MLEISSDTEDAVHLIMRHAQIYMEDLDFDEKMTRFKVFAVIETVLWMVSNYYMY